MDERDDDEPVATAVLEVLFALDDPMAVPRFTVTGFVWNDKSSPRPAAVPAMTKGARFIGRDHRFAAMFRGLG